LIRPKIEQSIVKDSTPGYPWIELGCDNGTVLTRYGDFIWDCVADDFNRMLYYGEDVFKMSPVELVQNGLTDPVKVFLKDEPHSEKKILSGKLRLIASVSLKEQIKTKIFANSQNKAEIATWGSCPSKPGLGLHDEGLRVIAANARNILRRGLKINCSDISGWDWSMQYWEIMLDAKIRCRLAGSTEHSVFGLFTRQHAHFVAASVFVTPDGVMHEQTVLGGQLSGDQNTSPTNSRGRICASLFARLLAGEPLILDGEFDINAAGDDCFERDFPGLKEGLEIIGHKVKDTTIYSSVEGFEFCSQTWSEDGTARPTDPSKTFFRFLSHKMSDTTLPELEAQLLWYFRHLAGQTKDVIGDMIRARVARAQTIVSNGKAQSKDEAAPSADWKVCTPA
jgi:hypothetical protein